MTFCGVHCPPSCRFIRQYAAVFNGSTYGMPAGIGYVLFHWRKDVLQRFGQQPPKTWDDLLAVAKAINGSDYNGDGVPDFAICGQLATR